ncbi:MAG: hypothetical protein M3P26_03540, partial [Gemmatimonadota bacterium]|nr:hypothetical protein [Gemmatimonadota bacterium]
AALFWARDQGESTGARKTKKKKRARAGARKGASSAAGKVSRGKTPKPPRKKTGASRGRKR